MLVVNGTETIDSATMTNVDINSGTIDGTNVTVGAGKTLDVSAGTLTLAADQVLGVSVADATTTTVGVAELATTAEAVAGTDTTRIITAAGNAASEAVVTNPLAPSQAVNITAGATDTMYVGDDNNLDFGTGNFTLRWKGSLPDYTPTTTPVFFDKRQDGSNRYQLSITSTTGIPKVVLNSTTYPATVTTGLTDGVSAEITAVITRETASVAGSIVFYVNGVQLGTSVEIAAGAPPSMTNTGPMWIMGQNGVRTAGTVQAATAFNRALTAAEVLSLYRNGVAFADKSGSQTAVYTSDFSAGTDGWSGVNGTAAGNIDAIGGEDNWLRLTVDNVDISHYLLIGDMGGVVGDRYRCDYTYYLPSSNSDADGVRFLSSNGTTFYSDILTVTDAATSGSFEFTDISLGMRVYPLEGGANVSDAGGDDVIYIKNVVITRIGATLDLEPDGIQPAPGQWLDSSSNGLHAWMPAAGASTVLPMRTFEVRGTNTWAGTHEAQSINSLTDQSKAILPANAYITHIIGTVSGATIEDIIIGDGSDTDRFVEITTGLATGTTSFTIANPTTDGINYELVVDPDANFTGSIVWTIKGLVLEA